MPHYVYILVCADNTLYVGCTNNVERRVGEHNASKRGAHYTKIRRPVALMYSEQQPSLKAARAREAEIKRMKRDQKLAIWNA